MSASRSIYDFPDVYDKVLRAPLKQMETEVRSIHRLLQRDEVSRARILELACGTSTHGILLAKKGHSITGVDWSQSMLNGANKRAESAGVSLDLIHSDVIEFSLDRERFDCAIFMAETFPLITESGDIRSHLESVRRHIKKGGLYIIDIDAPTHGIRKDNKIWGRKSVTVNGNEVEVWYEDFPGDRTKGTNHLVMHCRIHLDDEVVETSDDWHVKQWSPVGLSTFVESLDGWQLDGSYSWKDLSEDISDCKHFFAVLKKR